MIAKTSEAQYAGYSRKNLDNVKAVAVPGGELKLSGTMNPLIAKNSSTPIFPASAI
jgi:hypothetical protein